jgi:apolipoprotein N-acyltransferase
MARGRSVSRAARSALVAGHVAATFLAFPFLLAGRLVDLGWLFAWLAPALLLLALRGLAPRTAAAVGFGASLLAHTAVWHWIYVVTVVYGHAPAAVGVLAPALLAIYPALFGAAFGAGFAALAARGLAGPFAVALVWTALDHARSFFLSGWPWATLGYAQHQNAALLPLVAWTGVYGLSFVSALGGAAIAAFAEGRRRAAAAAAGGVALAHALGLVLVPPSQGGAPAETLRVAVLQGNIEQGVKWSDAWRERTLAIYADQTREAARRGARLIVWPETALPGALEVDRSLAEAVEALARETGAWLVVGGVGLAFEAGPGRPSHYFDSAFVISPDGELRDRYDKTHLVPFGEYVPLRGLLGLFVRSVASGIAPADVSEGARPRSIRIEPDGRPISVGVAVCFELIFPDLVRRFAADGAALLLGITNDAWYGRTGAPYQFLAISALRSAETGLWMARAANTGVSAFVDAAGRVTEATPIFEPALLVADLPLHPDPRRATFYVRHGDLFARGCWLAVAILAGTAWRRQAARSAARSEA